jgi:hypothetical protein
MCRHSNRTGPRHARPFRGRIGRSFICHPTGPPVLSPLELSRSAIAGPAAIGIGLREFETRPIGLVEGGGRPARVQRATKGLVGMGVVGLGKTLTRGVLVLYLVLLGTGPLLADEGGTEKGTKSKTTRTPSARSTKDAPAVAKEAKKKKPGSRTWGPFRVSGSFDFQVIYDDNVFRYSDQNLSDFRHGIDPPKFKLDTYDDLILSPRVNLTLGRKLLAGKETTLRLGYTHWQYTSNPEKTNKAWAVRLRQPTIGRDAMELSYTYAPWAWIRQLSDRPPFTPRSTNPLVWREFNSTRGALLVAYSRRVSARISTRTEGGRTWRFYNRPFMENDNWEWNGAQTVSVAPSAIWKTSLKYAYAKVKSRAADTVGETAANTDDGDASYERDLYQATLDLIPNGLWRIDTWEILGQYQKYFYTSKQPYYMDPTHTGRQDKVTAYETSVVTKPVWGPVTMEGGYRYTKRRSSSATSTVEGAASIEEDKNYQNNRVWLGMSYPF